MPELKITAVDTSLAMDEVEKKLQQALITKMML